MTQWKIVEDENIADIKLEVFGKNRIDLLNNLIKSFAEIITEINNLKEKRIVKLKLSFEKFEDLVFDLVNKLIFLKDTQFFIAKSANFKFEKKSLIVDLKGQKITNNLPIKIDIKALTNHKFSVKKNKKWRAILVFDV